MGSDIVIGCMDGIAGQVNYLLDEAENSDIMELCLWRYTIMSIQSDVEIMSIRVLEGYAQEHQLSENEAVSLFYKYQVFEKLILQHEYLHQLDFSETIRYVEEIMEQKSSVLVLYHGTNVAFDEIDLSKSRNRRDFGKGFYCTILENQAKEWAHRLYMRNYTLMLWIRNVLNSLKATDKKAETSIPSMW